MASGYLGKISAVVSANTADFQAKLSASGKDVSNFAKVVQSNLTSASRAAAKSLEGIYTPLQRFERAMQAAGSMKLSFKGFPGMIKDLDALQQRLNATLTNRQVAVVLKTTGLSSVSAVREAIAGLKSKDIEIVTRMGGLDKLKEIQSKISLDVNADPATSEIARLQKVVEAANARLANLGKTPVTVAVSTESLDALNAKANSAREAVGKLMSGEFLGDKSLSKEIAQVEAQVNQMRLAVAEAQAAKAKLQSSGTTPSQKKLNAAEAQVTKATGERDEFEGKLAQLKAYRAEIKQLNREIKESSTGSGTVGGEEKSREAAIRAVTKASRELQQQLSAKYGVDIDITSLNQLVDRADKAGSVIGNLGLLIENLGKSDFEAAADSARKMQSASAQIFTPLEAAVKRLAGLAVEFQAPFHDALKDTQADAQRLTLAIQEVGKEGPGPELAAFFADVQAKAQGAVGAIDRLFDVTQKIGQLKTGREFAFEQPGLNEAINRGAAIGNQAAALPAEGLRSNPAIAQSMIDVRRLTEEAGVAYSKLLNLQAQKLPTSGAQAEVDALVGKIIAAQTVAEREIKFVLDTGEAQQKADALATKMEQVRQQNALTITGRPQNMEQADSRLQGLRGDISGLDRSQRQNYGPLLQDANVAMAMGDLDKVEDVLDKIAFKVATDKKFNVTTTEAKAKLDSLNAELQSIASSMGEPVGMERLRKSAVDADAAVRSLKDSIDKTRLSGEVGDLKVDLASAQRLPVGDTRDQAIDNISSRAEGITRDAGNVAGREAWDEGKIERFNARIRSLNEAWAQSIRGLPETKAQIDSFLNGTLANVGKLNLADRISLDPMISEVMRLIQTGAGISTVTAKMLELEAATNELGSAGSVSAAIEKLSPTTARNDLEQRLAAAKAAETSPIPLATPGETVGDVGRETELRGSLGKDLADSSRQTDALRGGITSLKSQIDSLPESVRARFLPAIRDAENELIALAKATTPLPGRIEAARQRVQQLAADASRATQAMDFRQSFGGAGTQGINLGLDQRALQGYNAELQILQRAIGTASAEARGPAVAAFERLRNAVATAFREKNIDTAPVRQKLAALRADAVAAAAAVKGVSVGSLARDVSRAGDVGRGGADRWSMGLNQAAFAIDDLMSTSGGFEQKLRGVSNNLTQLGFVVGSTEGLFIGLGAVIAAQGAILVMKWINNGRTAEDQTKALNEALARQKGLVQELAEAFRSLGDSMSRGTRSAGAESGAEFSKQVSSVREKQREVRERRIADLDPGVQRGRADIVKLQKQLESSTDPGRRVGLQKDIRELEAADRRATLAAANRPVELPKSKYGPLNDAGTGPITGPAQVRNVIFEAVLRSIPNRDGPGGRELTQFEKEGRARSLSDKSGDDQASQRDAIESVIGKLRPVSEQAAFGFIKMRPAATASESIARLESLLQQLELPFQRASDELAVRVTSASEEAARSIRDSQEDVADAISRGVPGATLLQRQLDGFASELAEAEAKLVRAVEMQTELEDPAKRQALVKQAENQVEDVRGRQEETESRARALRLSRSSIGGDRTTSAISAMEGNERFKNERTGLIASARAAADAEMQAGRVNQRQAATVTDRRQQLQDARGQLRKVEDVGGDTIAAKAAVEKAEADLRAALASATASGANLDLARSSSDAAAALSEAAIAIEESLSRIRKLGDSATQRSEQGADAAQRAFEENPQRGGAFETRERAEQSLVQDRGRVANAQASLDEGRRKAQADPRMQAVSGELETIRQRRQDLEGRAAVDGGLNDADQKELSVATKREIELIRQRETLARQLTEAERKQLDAINNGILAREKELERSRQRTADDPTFKRSMDAANQIMADSERQANEAQQRYINNPTDKTRQERDEADARLRSDRERAQKLQDDLDNKRKEIEKDPEVAANNKAIAENDKRRAAIAEKEATVGLNGGEAAERDRLQEENRRMRGENEATIAAGTRPEQRAIDEGQFALNQRDRARRGRELGMTERERFKRDMEEGTVADLTARAKKMQGRGQDPAAFLRQGIANQMESVAPMMEQMQMEREDARLQGPSRKALQVADVSTSQGASELTRLLRGDDSAKDLNLAELKKQSQKMETLIDAVKAANPTVLL